MQTLDRIFKGDQPITHETANRLELVTGTPASFWCSLESQYRLRLAKLAQDAALAADLGWLKTIPVRELINRGVIPKLREPVATMRAVLQFYEVGDVKAWHAIWEKPAVAARRSARFASNPGATSAWLQLGKRQARDTECAPFEAAVFKAQLKHCRTLTQQTPESFIPALRRACALAGVALVLVPEIKGAPWSGAAEWLSPSKAMIILNQRGKAEDRFWFTFFHEAGHLLHDSKKATFIDDGKAYQADPEERRADEFAAEMLIPRSHHTAIAAARTNDDIRRLARHLAISPGIVAGRYRFLTGKWTHFGQLIQRLEWRPEAV